MTENRRILSEQELQECIKASSLGLGVGTAKCSQDGCTAVGFFNPEGVISFWIESESDPEHEHVALDNQDQSNLDDHGFPVGALIKAMIAESRGVGKVVKVTSTGITVEWNSGNRTFFSFSYLESVGPRVLRRIDQ